MRNLVRALAASWDSTGGQLIAVRSQDARRSGPLPLPFYCQTLSPPVPTTRNLVLASLLSGPL
jgi:hypothetical protein